MGGERSRERREHRRRALRATLKHLDLYVIIFSGASIALAALLLILPGFITDAFGFLLLPRN